MTVKFGPELANLERNYTCNCSSEFSEHITIYLV